MYKDKYKEDKVVIKSSQWELEGVGYEGFEFIGGFSKMCISNVNFKNATFLKFNLLDVKFIKTQMQGANFKGAILKNVTFEGVNLKGANFKGAELHNVKFISVNLQGVDFQGVDLQNAKFSPDCLLEKSNGKTNKLQKSFFKKPKEIELESGPRIKHFIKENDKKSKLSLEALSVENATQQKGCVIS